jgi:hypothetical protein
MTAYSRAAGLFSSRACAALPLLALLAALSLSGCSSLIGPREVVLTQDKLQQGLDRKFPVHQRALAVFDIELSHPQLAIASDNGRVSLALEANVVPLLARQSWHGSMVMSGRLVLDQARNAVFLSDAHVDRLEFDGMDQGRQQQLASVANLLGDKVMRDVPVYTFKPEELRYAGVQFTLTNITTRPGALVATVQPAQ